MLFEGIMKTSLVWGKETIIQVQEAQNTLNSMTPKRHQAQYITKMVNVSYGWKSVKQQEKKQLIYKIHKDISWFFQQKHYGPEEVDDIFKVPKEKTFVQE